MAYQAKDYVIVPADIVGTVAEAIEEDISILDPLATTVYPFLIVVERAVQTVAIFVAICAVVPVDPVDVRVYPFIVMVPFVVTFIVAIRRELVCH